MKRRKMAARKAFSAILVCIFLIGIFTGCAAKKSENAALQGPSSKGKYDVNLKKTEQGNTEASNSPLVGTTSSDGLKDGSREGGENSAPQEKSFGGHKIIQTGEIYLETLQFEDSIKKLTAYVDSIGGFVQNEDVQGKGSNIEREQVLRSASFVFRVPTSKFNDFFTKSGNFGAIRNQARHGEDITDQYSDTQTRLETMKVRQERLLTLLKKATKLSDIIELEKELQDVAYEIDSMTGSLKKWDSLISFSTITVNVQEVAEVTIDNPGKKEPLGEKMLFGLKESLKSVGDVVELLLILLMYLLPYGLIIGVLTFVVLKIRKQYRKKHPKKMAQPMVPPVAQPMTSSMAQPKTSEMAQPMKNMEKKE